MEFTPRRIVGQACGLTRLESSGSEFKLKLERLFGELHSGHRSEPMRPWYGHLKTPERRVKCPDVCLGE